MNSNGRPFEFLHQNIVLRSDKQNSAQGSVFYVKKEDDPSNQEYVLKVVCNFNTSFTLNSSLPRFQCS